MALPPGNYSPGNFIMIINEVIFLSEGDVAGNNCLTVTIYSEYIYIYIKNTICDTTETNLLGKFFKSFKQIILLSYQFISEIRILQKKKSAMKEEEKII